MKISYAIPVCNEFIEIQKLIGFLLKNKRQKDEIVVLFDTNNGTKEVENFLDHYVKDNFNWFILKKSPFNKHFAEWKNLLSSYCSGDYIFQIDADEILSLEGIKVIPQIIEANPTIEVYRVPRINTVKGLTEKHIKKWRWRINEKGWINYPDLQWRIYKNIPKIKWKNKVHEVLEGHKTFASLPPVEEYALYHPKSIDKQEKQNKYYETL